MCTCQNTLVFELKSEFHKLVPFQFPFQLCRNNEYTLADEPDASLNARARYRISQHIGHCGGNENLQGQISCSNVIKHCHPRNPRYILEAADGSNKEDEGPAPEVIEVEDDDNEDGLNGEEKR